jgi:hypothetical protein
MSRGVTTLLRMNKEKTIAIEDEQKEREGEKQLLVILTK